MGVFYVSFLYVWQHSNWEDNFSYIKETLRCEVPFYVGGPIFVYRRTLSISHMGGPIFIQQYSYSSGGKSFLDTMSMYIAIPQVAGPFFVYGNPLGERCYLMAIVTSRV